MQVYGAKDIVYSYIYEFLFTAMPTLGAKCHYFCWIFLVRGGGGVLLHCWNAQTFAQGPRLATLHEPGSHATTTKSSKYRSQVSAQTLAQGYTQVWATFGPYKFHPEGTL